MFTRKQKFSSRLKFNKQSFNEIIRLLNKAGFSKIRIKIPNKYSKFDQKLFNPEEFQEKEYNFSAQILIAHNESVEEVIKILFVNNPDSKMTFDDKTFPSSHSDPSQYYIGSNDPIRLLGLDDFVQTLLDETSVRSSQVARLQTFFLLVSGLIIFGGPIIISSPNFLISDDNLFIYFVFLVLSIFYALFHITHPGGLFITTFEHPLISFARRIFVGDFEDNLIITSAIWILKVIVIGSVVGLISNIIWAYFSQDILQLLPL